MRRPHVRADLRHLHGEPQFGRASEAGRPGVHDLVAGVASQPAALLHRIGHGGVQPGAAEVLGLGDNRHPQRPRAAARPRVGAGTHQGSRASRAAMTCSAETADRGRSRAIGPWTESSCDEGERSAVALGLNAGHPAEGRPQPRHAARVGREADRAGDVVAMGQRHDAAATAADAPPLEPPGVCARDHGLNVRPRRSLSVSRRKLNAGVLVRPTMTAPAAFRFATTGLSSVAMRSRNATTPLVVAHPAWSTFSLMATGTPCSGPSASPRATAASARSAAASASCPRSTVTAFRRGLTPSMRARQAETASREEIARARIASAMRVASHLQTVSLRGSLTEGGPARDRRISATLPVGAR